MTAPRGAARVRARGRSGSGGRRSGRACRGRPSGRPGAGWRTRPGRARDGRRASCRGDLLALLALADPAADLPADLQQGLAGELVAVAPQALQVPGESHLETEHLQAEVRPPEQVAAVAVVL